VHKLEVLFLAATGGICSDGLGVNFFPMASGAAALQKHPPAPLPSFPLASSLTFFALYELMGVDSVSSPPL